MLTIERPAIRACVGRDLLASSSVRARGGVVDSGIEGSLELAERSANWLTRLLGIRARQLM